MPSLKASKREGRYSYDVTTHVVRLKLFRLKAEGTRKTRLPHFGGEMVRLNSPKVVFPLFLTVFSLQSIHLSSYVTIYILTTQIFYVREYEVLLGGEWR